MAEAINWTAFRNQGVYGMPPPFELSRIPEMAKKVWSHPFAQKIRDGVFQAASAWWENVNPTKIKDKDAAWRIGLAVGLVESAAFTFLLPGSGVVKGSINFAATQGSFIGARYFNIPVEPQIKNFFKGVSAGGAYFSLPLGALNEISFGTGPETQPPGGVGVAPEASPTQIAEVTPAPVIAPEGPQVEATPIEQPAAETTPAPTSTPVATPSPETVVQVPPQPTATVEPAVEAPPPAVVTPVAPPTEVTTPPVDEARKIIESKVEQMQNNEDFKTSLAANVGKELPIQDKIIEDALAKQGKSISDLSPEALDSARKAVQTALENQVNNSADEALRSVIAANPDIDISSEQALDLAKQATKAQYEGWLAEAISQDKLVQATQAALSEQVQAVPAAFTAKLAQFMAENQDNSELFTEHIVARGETAGHLVLKMGEDVKWDGSDWQAFAALHAINPDTFADLQTATGLSKDELEELVKKMQSGDLKAYRKLIEEMGLVRAGARIRLLTPEGMRRLLMFAKSQ